VQVPFARSSLNHDDVFILDTENKIYQFNGANSNIQERAKALEVIQFLKEKYHDGTCDVAIVGKSPGFTISYHIPPFQSLYFSTGILYPAMFYLFCAILVLIFICPLLIST
jgi:hypothetical protein